MRKFIDRLLKPNLIGRLKRKINRRRGRSIGASYLDRYGWQLSNKARRPIDQHGNPLPWMTYPALSVLEKVVLGTHRVFEYGCGGSSLWFSSRAASVVSVEHDLQWASEVGATAPRNLTIVPRGRNFNEPCHPLVDAFHAANPRSYTSGFEDLDNEHGITDIGYSAYATEIANHGGFFDIVIVDGMARSLTAFIAAKYLKDDGFIVFDNAERWQYNPGFKALRTAGFGRVDFRGLGPCNDSEWTTSIFFKTSRWSEPLIELDESTVSGLDWMIAQRLAAK